MAEEKGFPAIERKGGRDENQRDYADQGDRREAWKSGKGGLRDHAARAFPAPASGGQSRKSAGDSLRPGHSERYRDVRSRCPGAGRLSDSQQDEGDGHHGSGADDGLSQRGRAVGCGTDAETWVQLPACAGQRKAGWDCHRQRFAESLGQIAAAVGCLGGGMIAPANYFKKVNIRDNYQTLAFQSGSVHACLI